MSDSRIPGLYRLSISERIDELRQRGWLSETSAKALRDGRHVMVPHVADKIVENVVGVFSLPLAIAPNFLLNGRDYIVPMVVEEPSIVAGLSVAAKLARPSGGFEFESDESLLVGQVHVADVDDVDRALAAIDRMHDELIADANAVHPGLLERGGGVREIDAHRLALTDDMQVIAVHLLVDTCDAMGANIVNTVCEAIAPRIAKICGGTVALRILSNLADRSLVTARVRYRVDDLATPEADGAKTRDAIILAGDIALADPYRAATHNKGVMNGIDPLAIATGNDWRAIEAGAHAFAASTGRYQPLTSWRAGSNGDLLGKIRLPLKVGIVGGTVAANPSATMGLEIAGVESARELAGLMAAVGLAQNFAALRALATTGIQEGHMRLHARSVAAAARVPDGQFDDVVTRLVADGEIKARKAREILEEMRESSRQGEPVATAAGKVILLGEHAVIYGRHALALPIADAVSAEVEKTNAGVTLSVLEWGISRQVGLDDQNAQGIDAAVALILRELGIDRQGFAIRVRSKLPPAMGLGSSAAIAVAIVRAFDNYLGLVLDDVRVNEVAFECEKLAHGTPSGIDNTIATYAKPMLFRNGASLQIRDVALKEVPPIVIASSGHAGFTREQVAHVRTRYEQKPAVYDALFDEIDGLSRSGIDALERTDYAELGLLMNVCHGLLNALEVSTPELERMVAISRDAGALGAKLTGAGGGGSIVSLCPGAVDEVESAMRLAGYTTVALQDG